MNMDFIFELVQWVAVLILSIAYWLQLIKIHKHKEVRDLSLYSYSIISIGYFLMASVSVFHYDIMLLTKSVAVLIPCSLIVMLIDHNKHCEWVDTDNFKCHNCGKLLQPYHLFCSSCGKKTAKFGK